MNIYNNYYGHAIPMGAWQGADVPGGSTTSSWTYGLVAQFAAGDTRTNYPSCLTTYRTQLAAAPNASLTVIETGFATCLIQLLQSPADSISSLTGAQLAQQKVSTLVIMGRRYPSGTQPNFGHDPAN